MKLQCTLLLLLLLFCLVACTKEDKLEVDSLMDSKYVMTLDPVQNNTDEFQANGEIVNPEKKVVTEYGFVFNLDGSGPLLSSGEKIVVGNPGNADLISNGTFSARWDVSVPDARYALRAYAILDGQVYYGKTFRYNSAPRGVWKKLADFPGSQRSFAFSFALNGKGYVCCGWSGNAPLQDCWEYDPAGDKWTQIADFPGSARSAGFSFVIDNVAYMGGGSATQPDLPGSVGFQDFYSFDAATKTWKRLADFPTGFSGNSIYGTFHFAANGTGFVGGGRYGYQTLGYGIMSYQPATNVWTEYSGSPQNYQNEYLPLSYAASFVIGDTAFIGSGLTGTPFGQTPSDEFFKFYISEKRWQTLGSLPGYSSQPFNAGTTNSGLGLVGFGGIADVWQYQYSETGSPWKLVTRNPDNYLQKSPVCFTIGNKTYIGLGLGYSIFNASSMYELTLTK